MQLEDMLRTWPADLLCSECGDLLVPRCPPREEKVLLACKSCMKNAEISMQNLYERIGDHTIDLLEETQVIDPDKLSPEAKEAFFKLVENWTILKEAGITVDQILETLYEED